MLNTRTNISPLDEARGNVSAILFGEIMCATGDALRAGDRARARGLAEAGEILSGISAELLLERLA